ncbi:MAG TPA: aminotransferase class I/II-fold pyridoxal phosphate-dependent enzyme [Euryarchaeota archaeon]|nr:aminotransferase class I/II-fold pyridoxal phosphate-dependent enzyme [Euryarchaeota archaeon]
MKDRISTAARSVPPSGIRKFFEMVLGMPEVISLGVGEPDFVAPWHIREACIYSLEKGYTMYTSNYGLLELREEISKFYNQWHNLDYNPESEILITTGVSEGYDLAIRALVNPGDEVLIPEPSYVSYKPCTVFAGGKPVVVTTNAEDEFKVRAENLRAAVTEKSKAMVINYPNNPTGATMTKKELEEIADIAVEHDLTVISDEVYGRLTYEGRHTPFSSLEGMRERTAILDGFSKAYAMTGFRIAFSLAPEDITDAMMKVHQYTMLCAPITGQMSAIEALRNGEREVATMTREYNRRRRVIVKRLNEIGLTCFTPKGAFYAFPSIKSTGLSSEEFSTQLLKSKKVAVVPGTAFGECGEGHIRCSYATSMEDLKTALNRIEDFTKSL